MEIGGGIAERGATSADWAIFRWPNDRFPRNPLHANITLTVPLFRLKADFKKSEVRKLLRLER